jgi:Chalcone isomerase-like
VREVAAVVAAGVPRLGAAAAVGTTRLSALVTGMRCRVVSLVEGKRIAASVLAGVLLAGIAPLDAFAFDAAAIVRETIPQARVQGEGELRMYGFHIYNAKLYVGPTGLSSTQVTSKPFALDIEYARDFRGAAIAKKGREQMDELGLASKTQTANWEKQLAGLFPDVRAGDHLVAIYMPARGTTFYADDTRLGTIPGDDFAKAFFAIWLDPRTAAPGLRNALLANGAAE